MKTKSTLKLAKELDFTTEEEYFNYIIESDICGNFSQVRGLFKDMDEEGKKDFMNYLNSSNTQVMFSQESIKGVLKHIY